MLFCKTAFAAAVNLHSENRRPDARSAKHASIFTQKTGASQEKPK
jgi:hypothetical protein